MRFPRMFPRDISETNLHFMKWAKTTATGNARIPTVNTYFGGENVISVT